MQVLPTPHLFPRITARPPQFSCSFTILSQVTHQSPLCFKATIIPAAATCSILADVYCILPARTEYRVPPTR